ncbi:MAG: Gfo/Idh/MocA family oxidoreductase [Ruminiclostridium sp.]|nr:Gfo/Idh/MocA family oxidoreductase [Ruminiclostridium sp.]
MKNFKVVVAGCGGQSALWMHYAVKRSDTEIVGLIDINRDSAVKAAEKFSLSCPVFDNPKDAIKNTGANLIFNLTTPAAHRDIIITSLESGCDVFTEKPLGATWEHVLQIKKVVGNSVNRLTVMQNRRYLKGIRALRDIFNSGMIGDITFLGVDFFLYPLGDDHWYGYRTKINHPLITDMAIHTFDMGRFLLNNADPVSVYCHEFQPKASLYKGNAGAVCIFEMSDHSVFTYQGNWCAEGCRTEWEGMWRATGVKGSAVWDGIGKPYFEIPMPENEKNCGYKSDRYKRIVADYNWPVSGGGDPEPIEACLEEMYTSLIEGKKSETDWSDNIKSMAMVCAAVKSAEEKRKVYIDELL